MANNVGWVTASTLNIRSAASTSASIVVTINSGEYVYVTKPVPGTDGATWYNVTYPKSGSNLYGCCSAQYITFSKPSNGQTPPTSGIPAVTPTTGWVTASTLNIRSGPGSTFNIIGYAPQGASVTVDAFATASDGTWYHITSPLNGYCSAQYITFTQSGTSGGGGSVYASVCSGTSTLNSTQMLANAQYISTYLQSQGFTKNAACGILGNIYAESKVNPGIWEGGHLRDPRGGYGLVQWTQANYATSGVPNAFLVYAASNGLISNNKAVTEVDALANNNPQKLMDAELACLIWCCTTRGDFFAPTAGSSMDHTGYRLTFTQFKASTLDAGTLAKVFHDHYEKSGDTATAIQNNRATPATKYYSSGVFS